MLQLVYSCVHAQVCLLQTTRPFLSLREEAI